MSSMAAFDVARYEGLWYEIARYPTFFQSGCGQSSATYAQDAERTGRLLVENACPKDGSVSVIRGSADVVGPGRLKVRLDGVPVAADYWVLWVDEGYRTAVVGVPSGRAAWVLNREPTIAQDRWAAALKVLEFNGYRTQELLVSGGIDG